MALSSIRDEILELSNTLALSQSQLLRLAKRVEQQDQDTANWETRYADLEVAYKEALTSAKWLREHNVELERKIANHRPEVINVLSAREDAFRKLKHARKVIRDLIDEKGDSKSPTSRAPTLQEDIAQALYGESRRGEDSPSTDSDKTARLAAAPQNSTNTSTSQLSQESQGSDRVRTGGKSVSEDSQDVESEHSVASLSPQTSQSSLQSLEERRPTTPEGPQWQIHYEKPPGASVVTEGPLSTSTLQNDLSLDDYMVFSLQSLVDSSDFSMRFQVIHLHSGQNVACLYDPIFIEIQERSYILDWGLRQTNENMRKYITRHKGIDPVFHTFTFPLTEGGWFYIGAQNWSVVDFETIWPLGGKSRKAIIKKLFKRSQDKVSKTEIAKLLDSGELVQFCVEITAVADTSVSHDFSRDMLGYRTSEDP